MFCSKYTVLIMHSICVAGGVWQDRAWHSFYVWSSEDASWFARRQHNRTRSVHVLISSYPLTSHCVRLYEKITSMHYHCYDLSTFTDFLSRHPVILQPLLRLRKTLRRCTLGILRWYWLKRRGSVYLGASLHCLRHRLNPISRFSRTLTNIF